MKAHEDRAGPRGPNPGLTWRVAGNRLVGAMLDGTTDSQRGAEADGPVPGVADEREFQELWFALARRPWSSLVLVPADPGESTAHVAHALADVGKRLSDTPVTAVAASTLEYGTAVALAGLPQFVDRRRLPAAGSWPTIDLEAHPDPPVEEPAPPPAPAPDGPAPAEEAIMVSSAARLIISIPPVVSEPLGLATTASADLVLICIALGQTRLANARRTVELIGRERVAGCFLLR